MNRSIEVRSLLLGLAYVLLVAAGTVLGITVMMTLAVYFRQPEGREQRRPPLLD